METGLIVAEDELNIIVCKKKGETLITVNPLFFDYFIPFTRQSAQLRG